jgi:hypothetical protein
VDAVGICNLALGWLGERAITTLDAELGTTEELCARLYPEALRVVLEARAWTFATQRLQLGPAEATGLVDFPSRYPIPTTVIRVLTCDDGTGTQEIEWRREGAYVLTQTSPPTVSAKAIVLVEDPALFSPTFGRALAARIAADLAGPITENRSLAADMEQRYQLELRQAGTRDGLQGTSESTRSSGLAARRW